MTVDSSTDIDPARSTQIIHHPIQNWRKSYLVIRACDMLILK
jgi:hypothetical protein